MKAELIDCHAHLPMKRAACDALGLGAMLGRCEQQGVVAVVISLACEHGTLEANPEAVERAGAKSHVGVAVTFGFQPPSTREQAEASIREMPGALQSARRLARDGKIQAIGEVGLDYHWPLVNFLESQGIRDREDAEREIEQRRSELLAEPEVKAVLSAQADTFGQWIELAIETDLPLVVHERDAYADAVELIAGSDIPAERVMLHCFGAGVDEARDALARGHWISLPASVVYRQPYRDVARIVELGKTLLETDSPYHSPIVGLWKQAFREATDQADAEGLSGKALDSRVKEDKERMFAAAVEARMPGLVFDANGTAAVPAAEYFKSSSHRNANEPAFVRCGAVALAELRGLDIETVCEATTANARRFYGL